MKGSIKELIEKLYREYILEPKSSIKGELKLSQNILLIASGKNVNEYKELLELHDTSGNRLVNEIFRTAQLSFENGMIDYTKFAASIETALQIKLDYFDNVFKYNQATLELNYLSE